VRKFGWPTLACVMISFLTATASAGDMKPIEVYRRCYIRMTRQIPDVGSARYKAVEQGKKSPVDACMEVFDSAAFGSNGIMMNRTNAEAKRVVKTFNDLHVSWFQSKNYPGSTLTHLVIDHEEPALYFTRAAFMPSEPIKSVLTLSYGLQGVRDQLSYPAEINDWDAQSILTYKAEYPYAKEKVPVISYVGFQYNSSKNNFSQLPGLLIGTNNYQTVRAPASVEVGALVGVKKAMMFNLPNFVPFRPGGDINKVLATIAPKFPVNQHFGGGVLGSQSFLLANANLGRHVVPHTYAQINRRIGARVFEDLLCHQLPTLDAGDVVQEVDLKSAFTFQTQQSCMRCHSTVDGLATGLRNFVIFRTQQANPPNAGLEIEGMMRLTPMAGSSEWALQQPVGKLHYRENITRKIVKNVSFSSLADLGNHFASGNDFYLCAAKRYYQFFTGINVDLTEPAKASLDKYHQDLVVSLGQKLKSTQSVRTLIRDIIASEPFQTRNYLAERLQ